MWEVNGRRSTRQSSPNADCPFCDLPHRRRSVALTFSRTHQGENQMASEYWEEKRAGLKQVLAAWAVLLAVMAAVQFAHLLAR
jgi:hypothetical protein